MEATMSRTRSPKSYTGWAVALGVLGLLVVSGALFANRASNPPETGPMGGLLYEAEAATSGRAVAAGIEVEGAEITLGLVPLNVTVMPEWTLTNRSDRPVSLGEPHASVVEGCCPGTLELTATTLAPGASATLSFPLQMHPGMDGPHDFDIHVPIVGSDELLTLGVTGDFG